MTDQEVVHRPREEWLSSPGVGQESQHGVGCSCGWATGQTRTREVALSCLNVHIRWANEGGWQPGMIIGIQPTIETREEA